MSRIVTLDADGNQVEDDGYLCCGANAEQWHDMYEGLYDAISVIDKHRLLLLQSEFSKLKDDSALSPSEYIEKRGLSANNTFDRLRADMLNDIIDRYEDLLGGFLGKTLGEYGL